MEYADDVAGRTRVAADADIVHHGEIGEQRHILEGAADADLGDLVRRARQDAGAFHQDVAGRRLIETGQAVEQRGLAGAVRADQPRICPLCMSKVDAVQGDDAAEHDADVANGEQGGHCPARAVPASFRSNHCDRAEATSPMHAPAARATAI